MIYTEPKAVIFSFFSGIFLHSAKKNSLTAFLTNMRYDSVKFLILLGPDHQWNPPYLTNLLLIHCLPIFFWVPLPVLGNALNRCNDNIRFQNSYFVWRNNKNLIYSPLSKSKKKKAPGKDPQRGKNWTWDQQDSWLIDLDHRPEISIWLYSINTTTLCSGLYFLW